MPYSNSIISAPVAMSDVQRALGSSSTDLGTLCSHANINKWAKYKPVRLPSVDTVTGQWSASLNAWLSSATWWKGDGLCGMSTDWATEFGNSLTTSGTFMYKLTHGLLGWNYIKPGGGGAQPYRLQDFAQYFHDAIQPYGGIGSTTIYLDNQGAGQIDWEVISVDSLNLKLSDISVNDHPLTDFYLGLILWKNNTWFLFTSDTKFSGESLSVALTNMSSYAGTWNCMPFFTLYRTNSGGTFDSNGLFISLADTTPISVELLTHGSNYFDYIDGEWSIGGTYISFELQIANETASAHTYTSITISIYKDSLSSDTVATKTLTNITVSANSQRTLTDTISVSKVTGSVYWIAVADNTSGSTIPGINNQVEDYSGM